MADQTQCITCEKARVTYKCDGCSQTFCFNHLADHRQILNQQFDEIENERNLFRQIINEQTTNSQKYSLIEQINQWENDSIKKIKQTADDGRKLLLKYKDKHIHQIEMKLNKLTEELKQIRQENDFNEIHLNQFNEKLKKLKEELNQPKHLSIKQESTSFINQIFIQLGN
jgi:chromosome segregation ATPase